MQIQLNQNEIELALRNYVNGILAIQEGMDISITLKATRGDDGQTAIIDIVPAKKVVVETQPAGVAIQRRARTVAVNPTNVAANTAASNEANTKEDIKSTEGNAPVLNKETGVIESADNSTSSDAGVTTGDASDASQAGEGAAQGSEQPAEEKPRTSLFSGLSRPKNS